MTTYDNTNRGALFKNNDKQADTHADYRGSINVGGVEYWIDAWLKTSQKGMKFMSLSVKPKLAAEVKGGAKNPPAKLVNDDFDDADIPF